jgi:hypothetical protein
MEDNGRKFFSINLIRIFIADIQYNIRLILKDTEVATFEKAVFFAKNFHYRNL